MHGKFLFTGTSIEMDCKVEGFYFCDSNKDMHYILRGRYTVGMMKRQVNTEAVLVHKDSVQLIEGEKDG